MGDLASSLHGASGLIGAYRLYYICWIIKDHYTYERYPQLLDFYPSLVEAAIEFKIYSR